MTTKLSSNLPAPKHHQDALQARVAEVGEVEAARSVGLSRMGLYRALAGLPVTAGTRALLREAFTAHASSVAS